MSLVEKRSIKQICNFWLYLACIWLVNKGVNLFSREGHSRINLFFPFSGTSFGEGCWITNHLKCCYVLLASCFLLFGSSKYQLYCGCSWTYLTNHYMLSKYQMWLWLFLNIFGWVLHRYNPCRYAIGNIGSFSWSIPTNNQRLHYLLYALLL